jgi:hypothetical protein
MSARAITKTELIKQLAEGLNDADRISLDWHRGVMRDETVPAPFARATPTGVTLTIHINGGAVDFRRTFSGTEVTRGAPGE